MIGDRKIDIPSYTVTVGEEDSIHFTPESKIPEMLEKTKSEPVVETPAEDADKTSSEVVEKPAEVVEKPAEVVEKPAEVVEKPAEEVEKPVEVVEKPAEEVPKDKSSSTE